MSSNPTGYAKGNFLWKIYYPYLIFILLALILFGIFASGVFKDLYYNQTNKNLESDAYLISLNLRDVNIDSLNASSLNIYDQQIGARYTLIDTAGKVIADTRENAAGMENHRKRPEFIEALSGKSGFDKRYSHTKQTHYLYFAVPVFDKAGKVKAALRTSVDIDTVEENFSSTYYSVIMVGIGVVLLVSLIALFASKNITKPLVDLEKAAQRFSTGDFSEKIYPPKNKDLRALAESLNLMAQQLDEKLNIIGEQKNIQQAVLKSMKGGVLAVDYDEKVLLINETAKQILSVTAADVKDKTLQEIVRISEIHKFFKKIINEGGALQTEIVIQREGDKVLQLSGTALYDQSNNRIGVLVVINDISDLKHLDNLKRDLVANVSHELKTPITTIKGFVELLREGEIKEPEKSRKFLEIIYNHTERLNAIVEDLLTLSRLEQGGAERDLRFEARKLKPVLKSVEDEYGFKAKEKSIDISLKCDDELSAKIDQTLIRQALGNLLDNALKYSEKKTKVEMRAFGENGFVVIEVEDEGFGIAKEHFPRLFERFYRIEKSRSRDEGGTGLGLSIVKHIAQIHGGTVEVESELNKGSIFRIKFPLQLAES
jgi:two-component system, OmpR family, phosphate regulon sensor histidine kinase PhoR